MLRRLITRDLALPQHLYRLGPAAHTVLAELSLDLPPLLAAPRSARPLLRFCIDWTEQRHHVAGCLGTALLTPGATPDGLARRPGHRAIRLTEIAATALRCQLGLALSDSAPGA